METIRIDILNPKAKSIINNLADLDLIKIKNEIEMPEFNELLAKLRINSDSIPAIEEITAEVEAVRKTRYAK